MNSFLILLVVRLLLKGYHPVGHLVKRSFFYLMACRFFARRREPLVLKASLIAWSDRRLIGLVEQARNFVVDVKFVCRREYNFALIRLFPLELS